MTCDTVCGHKCESHNYVYLNVRKHFVLLTQLTPSFKFLFPFIKKKTENNLTESYICWLLLGLQCKVIRGRLHR